MTRGLFDPPFDPLALWRDMLAKWQAAVSDTAGTAAAPAEYVRLMNQTMDMSVQLQQVLGVMMGKYLAALNMPTRADLAAMDARLRAIEDQLARLGERAASASAELSPAANPVHARLESIEGRLARLGQQVTSAAAKPSPAAKPVEAKPVAATSPRSKHAPQPQPSSRPEPAIAPAVVHAAAQAAHAAKPARRVAKKPSKAS